MTMRCLVNLNSSKDLFSFIDCNSANSPSVSEWVSDFTGNRAPYGFKNLEASNWIRFRDAESQTILPPSF